VSPPPLEPPILWQVLINVALPVSFTLDFVEGVLCLRSIDIKEVATYLEPLSFFSTRNEG
jgi:hypothetical protein